MHPELGRGACLSQPGGKEHHGMWSAHLPGPAQVRRLQAAGVFGGGGGGGASGGEGNEDTWGLQESAAPLWPDSTVRLEITLVSFSPSYNSINCNKALLGLE